jgi:ribosomal protein L40E
MTEAELIREFITVRYDGRRTLISVNTIIWNGAHSPESRPVIAASIEGHLSKRALKSEVSKVLMSDRFFSVCTDCGERNPLGWMLSEEQICHECAVRNHGIVF